MSSPAAFPLLSLLVATPGVAALLLSAIGAKRPTLADKAAAAAAAVACGLAVWAVAIAPAEPSVWESQPWIHAFGSDYALGVDRMGAWLSLWVALLGLVVLVAPSAARERGAAVSVGFRARALFAESMMLGLLVARDTLLMLSFLSGVVVSMALVIPSLKARRKFLIYQLLGLTIWGGFFVTCYHLVYVETGFVSTALVRWQSLVLFPGGERALLLLALGASVWAMPLFPFSGGAEEAMGALARRERALLLGVFSIAGSQLLFELAFPITVSAVSDVPAWVFGVALASLLYAALMPGGGLARTLVGFQSLVLLAGIQTASAPELQRIAVAAGLAGLAWSRARLARLVCVVVLVSVPLAIVVPAEWHYSQVLAICTLVAVGLLAFRILRRSDEGEVS